MDVHRKGVPIRVSDLQPFHAHLDPDPGFEIFVDPDPGVPTICRSGTYF